MSKRVIRNSVNQALFDVPPNTVGRVTKEHSGDKFTVLWSDGSFGVYRRETLDFCDGE